MIHAQMMIMLIVVSMQVVTSVRHCFACKHCQPVVVVIVSKLCTAMHVVS